MISKKSRKVVAALLIGATVCASGTFAYFNSKTDLKNIMNKNAGAQNTLNITNGHVEIDGKIKTSEIGNVASNWTYDVARLGGVGDENTVVFESKHRSPDITGVGYNKLGKIADCWEPVSTTYPDGTSKDIVRVKIGSPVTGVITNARPGDAIVLGVAGTGGTQTGLQFINKSNITTNIKVDLNRNADGTIKDEVVAEFAKLAKAGWIVQINGVTYDLSNTHYANLNSPIKPAVYDVTLVAEPASDDYYGKWYPDAKDLPAAVALQKAEKDKYDADLAAYGTAAKDFKDDLEKIVKTVYAVAPAADIETGTALAQADFGLKIRFELPLLTENKFQDTQTVTNESDTTGVDIRNLFTVIATQENNPGWNVDGTDTQPFQD